MDKLPDIAVIGNWQIPVLILEKSDNAIRATIEYALQAIFEKQGLQIIAAPFSSKCHMTLEIRNPEERISGVFNWHQDGGDSSHLILWANEAPTEIRRVETREVFSLKDGDVVLFSNRLFEHCTPSKFIIEPISSGRAPEFYTAGTSGRWFSRISEFRLKEKTCREEKAFQTDLIKE